VPPPRPTKRQIVQLVQVWRARLHLEDWAIGVEVKRLTEERAHCRAMPEYKSATVAFDPRQVSLEELEGLVVHELMHCHVWGLAHVAETLAGANRRHQEWSRVEEEALVTRLERIVLAVAAGG
jgi:predicted SprT family Zn-dependent metalloprotease